MPTDALRLRPGEQRTFTFDFHKLPEISVSVDTISSIVGVSINPVTTPALSTGAMSIVNITDNTGNTSITYTSAGVTVVIFGGLTGTLYYLDCKVITAGGSTLICGGKLQVQDLQ